MNRRLFIKSSIVSLFGLPHAVKAITTAPEVKQRPAFNWATASTYAYIPCCYDEKGYFLAKNFNGPVSQDIVTKAFFVYSSGHDKHHNLAYNIIKNRNNVTGRCSKETFERQSELAIKAMKYNRRK